MFKLRTKSISLFIALIILVTPCMAEDSNIRKYFTGGTTENLDFTKMANEIAGTLMWIGYGLAICVITITGIQFLTASPQKKAMLKSKLWLIALAVIIFAAGVPAFVAILKIFNGLF